MPLIKGKSKKAFEHNLKAEMEAGKPQGQALAIAYSMKRKAQHKAKGGEVYQRTSEFITGGGGEPGGFSRGVHATTAEPGVSQAGKYQRAKFGARASKGIDGSNAGAEMYDMIKQNQSKKAHKAVLEEIRSMRPKSEAGEYAHGGVVQEHLEHDPEHEDIMHYGEPESVREKAKHEQAKKHAHGGEIHIDIDSHNVESEEELEDENEEESMAHGGDIVSRIMSKKYSKGGVVANEGDAIASHQADQHAREYDYLVEEGGMESTQHDFGEELGDAREDHDRHDIVSRIMHSLAKKNKMPKGYPGL